MFRRLSISQIVMLLVALFFGFLFAGSAQIHAQANAPITFTILGPDGAVARVITTAAQCPEITIDGTASAMQLRAAPDSDFPVTVCDAAIAPDVKSASVDGQALKLPKAKPERIVVVGDTGCRLKGNAMQSCNDPAAWPLAQIADSAAKTNPDLVIHVGDYHYREAPCVVDKANCAGSPYGDNWASWNADLFTPARSLLQAAPWVIVRGNHEDCQRAGGGYFRLLDPRPLPASCPAYTDPYAIAYVEPQLILADDSAVNDFQVEPEQLDTYKKQFEQINAQAAHAPTWILLHDPMYVFGHAGEKDGQEQLFQDQPTLQQASNNTFPETVQAFLAGHIHLFQALSFEQGRPPQLVVGNSGTLLDQPITTPLKGLEIAGMSVAEGKMLDQFGFVVMERSGAQWALGVKNASGGDMDTCILGGGKLLCGQTALPVGGGELQNQIWLALALLGASILVIGLALRARAMRYTTPA
jgi:hypothetical protein